MNAHETDGSKGPIQRPRRLRRTPAIRGLVRETRLHPSQLVLPVFVVDSLEHAGPIRSMPGCARHTVEGVVRQCQEAWKLGVHSFAIFPAIDSSLKTPDASAGLDLNGLACRAVKAIHAVLPDACVFADVALDPYSSHGHDGLVSKDGEILNDETVEVLAEMAVAHAHAGTDFVAPSDMMDGRVGVIRAALDDAGYTNVGILSYCAKYASAFYGPFRDALDSAPANAPGIPKDKKTYQMDPANASEALREAMLDEDEGADILMVKPALAYLDVIHRLSRETDVPIAAYQVSGEYAMIKAAGEKGWLDADLCMRESLLSIARAGASIVFTYAAVDYARWYRSEMA